jgi:hypothetical protein
LEIYVDRIKCTQAANGYYIASAVLSVSKIPVKTLEEIELDIRGNFDKRDADEYMCRPFNDGTCEFSIIINPHAHDCTLFQLINFQSALGRLGNQLTIDATPLYH